jgi:tRNA threonylcarbamoyladenosine biosynthesis protein TsaE
VIEPSLIRTLVDEGDTAAFAAELAVPLATHPGLVYLHGDLGAGKTTLVRGILRALGYPGHVRSPTYSICETYETPVGPVHHFDLYRLGQAADLEFIGGRDILGSGELCLIEWPERAAGWLPPPLLEITIRLCGETRQIRGCWHNTET